MSHHLNKQSRPTVSINAALVARLFVGIVITALVIVVVVELTAFKNGTTAALFWALGSLFSGGFLGFLFSIPQPIQDKPAQAAQTFEHLNTSLNQIVDWLTKIIVGVSLVNAQTAYTYFVRATKILGAGLALQCDGRNPTPAAQAFAAGLIVTFFILGFIGTYLLGRLWISVAVVRADKVTMSMFPDDVRPDDVRPAPNLEELSEEAATAVITRGAKLRLGNVTRQASEKVAIGKVISQDPASGSLVAEGSPVNLVISSGPPSATVPKIIEKSQTDATTATTPGPVQDYPKV